MQFLQRRVASLAAIAANLWPWPNGGEGVGVSEEENTRTGDEQTPGCGTLPPNWLPL